jgi:branched-chain amino acid aminotransferase
MGKLVWLNGVVTPLENAVTGVDDHAHLYGDGLFEGIRFYERKVFKLNEHIERLYHGTAYLGFEMTMSAAELTDVVLATCRQADIEDGYIRLNVTRGAGLGLDPAHIDRKPNVMVMVSSLSLYPPEAYASGLHVITSSFRVIPADSLDPRVKCIGRYASNILAKQEANRAGAGECLMLNHEGHIAECSGDNVFFIKGGVIRTPHPSCGILEGITRNTVIGVARKAGYPVVEDRLTPFDAFAADEAFLTGTAAEIIAMSSLDARQIGSGKPGPVTLKLSEAFRAETTGGVPF